MSRQQVVFTDPVDASSYTWPMNPAPDGIGAMEKKRSIDRTSNTGNVGLVKQQGDDGPAILHWTVHVFTEAHEIAMWQWFVKCRTRSIYLTDFDGEEYEGQIVTLSRQQVGVLAGPGDSNARGFYAVYVFEFEVWRFISGVLATAGVKP